jgi:hypothetical protein
MAKKSVKVLGWIFIVIGILGFIPGITSADGKLIGLFEVDSVHNIVHLISGILALIFAAKGESAAKGFAKVFGVIYGLVTIIGFMPSGNVLGLFMVNGADNVLHLVLALIFLYVGFAQARGMSASSVSSPTM